MFLAGYWEAFHVLSPSRQVGMTVGAIPLTEVLAYMQMFMIQDEDERRELLRYVQILDRVFLDHVRQEEQGEKESVQEETGRARRRGQR